MIFLGGCSQEHSHMQMAGFTQADVNHGEYEAKIFACQDCHTVRQADGLHLDPQLILAGGVPMPGFEGSFVYSANVTISGQYPAQVLDDTIRGRLMYKFRMPTALLNGMSADDMRDLVAYLKTLRPILHRPLPDDQLPRGFVMPAPNPRESNSGARTARGNNRTGQVLGDNVQLPGMSFAADRRRRLFPGTAVSGRRVAMAICLMGIC